MSEHLQTVCLGTRGSALARWQTDYTRDLLHNAWPDLDIRIQIISTHGDRVLETPLPLLGGKGVFTAELEAALHNREVDFAVHSLKDLPTENPSGLTIGATPIRNMPNDVLVSRKGYTLKTLPEGAVIGTSSSRRAAQLRYHRPDLHMLDIRGNIDTRINKALDPDGPYDAILLASAGLNRLGFMHVVSEILSFDDMLPAPGQAALGIQCRDEQPSLDMLAPLNHRETALAVTAERAFLSGLGGGCALPIAAFGVVEDDQLVLRGRVTAPDGRRQIDLTMQGSADLDSARDIGVRMAQSALEQGVSELLERLS